MMYLYASNSYSSEPDVYYSPIYKSAYYIPVAYQDAYPGHNYGERARLDCDLDDLWCIRYSDEHDNGVYVLATIIPSLFIIVAITVPVAVFCLRRRAG